MEVTVIVCTHNPRKDYLERVMQGLKGQSLERGRWELLVVDNASKEPVSEGLVLGWHPGGRCVREERLGLTEARLRGIRESRGELLIFVDDDNVLQEDYLEVAVRLSAEWPLLGVFGGGAEGEFERQPGESVLRYLHHLALRKVERPRWSNLPDSGAAEPWGAGMCLRRPVAEAYLNYCRERRQYMTDRRGQLLNSGGDNEICRVALQEGWGMGVFPQLFFIHLIPAFRVEEDYLVRLVEGMEFSCVLIGHRFHGTNPYNDWTVGGILRFLRNWLRSSGLERRMCVARFRGRERARRELAGWGDKEGR
jgi:glycosyltransferase involved in cell wall biosynthesis